MINFDRKEKIQFWALFTLVAILLFALIIQIIALRDSILASGDKLIVAFLDVGQGDATFIQAPNGVQVLIDAGANSTVLKEISKLMAFNDRTIDIVIATHPDLDHIGGIPEIFKRYVVETYIYATSTKKTEATDTVEEYLIDENSEIFHPKRGDRIVLDSKNEIYLDILFPDGLHQSADANDQSIITRLVYGEIEFLMTGDASIEIERYLLKLAGGLDSDLLESDILKVGHHGSKTSSAREFVEVVKPGYAIISAGIENRYGHPHQEVVDLFADLGIEIHRTDKNGTLIFVSDGREVSLQASP